MSRSMSTIQRLLGASAILCAASQPAAAQQAQPAQADAVSNANAMTVVRDADTHMLRGATPEEQAALNASKVRANARFAVPKPMTKYHSSGAVGARLTDEFVAASSVVATRGADGKIAIEHGEAGDGTHAAPAPVQQPTVTPATE